MCEEAILFAVQGLDHRPDTRQVARVQAEYVGALPHAFRIVPQVEHSRRQLESPEILLGHGFQSLP